MRVEYQDDRKVFAVVPSRAPRKIKCDRIESIMVWPIRKLESLVVTGKPKISH
jgi:hypothetical protein